MAVYSVYEPPSEAPDIAERADRLAFVKDGFSWSALIVPIPWLIYYRMWIELIVLVAIYVALLAAFGTDTAGQTLVAWASLAISIVFGFEANDLRAASLERRGYRLAGVVSGRDRTEAELSFFRVWLPQQAKAARGSERGHAPRRDVDAAPPIARGEGEGVIGLFPQP